MRQRWQNKGWRVGSAWQRGVVPSLVLRIMFLVMGVSHHESSWHTVTPSRKTQVPARFATVRAPAAQTRHVERWQLARLGFFRVDSKKTPHSLYSIFTLLNKYFIIF